MANSNSKKKPQPSPEESAKSFREGVESIVIAIVLAFLFRAFEAEAFVIPTGSMAPTLQGRHKDLECSACGYNYRAGDSDMSQGQIVSTTCPMCNYNEALHFDEAGQPEFDRRDISHTGDRILVNKFAYETPFGDPQRWDVIVFKFPGNAKQNYIKRLVALPNEQIKIQNGDLFTKVDGEYQVVRKPPKKLKHMLQLVHDSNYIPRQFIEFKWPSHWSAVGSSSNWKPSDDYSSYSGTAGGKTDWLTYRHLVANYDAWEKIDSGGKPNPILISDFYAYNRKNHQTYIDRSFPCGMHWVGDLALECVANVASDTGKLSFVLVEAGRQHQCDIDIATGMAELSINGGNFAFDTVDGQTPTKLVGQTSIRGAGKFKVRFSNCDNQLLFWINEKVIDFGHPATYTVNTSQEIPTTSRTEPGDMAPIRIGNTGLSLTIDDLRVKRDVYYIATSSVDPKQQFNSQTDYGMITSRNSEDEIIAALMDPEKGKRIFEDRRFVEFSLGEDQFFPLGDNSPMSRDARLWGDLLDNGTTPPFVERDMLIGKAVLVYWPHPYHARIPFTNKTFPCFPNFLRMKLIR